MISSTVLKKMIKVLKKKEIIAECKAALDDLKKDKDPDVASFCNEH